MSNVYDDVMGSICNDKCLSMSVSHPLVSFQREALTVFFWNRIREDFYNEFMDLFEYPQKKNVKNRRIVDVQPHVHSSINGTDIRQSSSLSHGTYHYGRWQHILSEQKRFRRHCKEALAKWVLSQKAREKGIFLSNDDDNATQTPNNNSNNNSLMTTDKDAAFDDIERAIVRRQSYFFPHAELLHGTETITSDSNCVIPVPIRPFYTQLIRDLTLKCDNIHKDNIKLARDITQFIEKDFDLFSRCEMAHKVIENICVGLCRDLVAVARLTQTVEGDCGAVVPHIDSDVKPSLPKKRKRAENNGGNVITANAGQTVKVSTAVTDHFRCWFEPTMKIVGPNEERTQLQQRIIGDIIVIDIVPVRGIQVLCNRSDQANIHGTISDTDYYNNSVTSSDVISLWLEKYCGVDNDLIRAAEIAYGKTTVNNNGKIFSSWFTQASSRHGGNRQSVDGVFGSEVPASVPRPVWDKMIKAYNAYAPQSDNIVLSSCMSKESTNNNNNNDSVIDLSLQHNNNNTVVTLSLALFRVAILAIRYESNLSSGSLQLCADGALKDRCAVNGYHVIDLCASPINAYMMPSVTVVVQTRENTIGIDHDNTTTTTTVTEGINRSDNPSLSGEPNVFCSAFLDTDYYFGSMGSATTLDFNILLRVVSPNDNVVDNSSLLIGTNSLRRMLAVSGAITSESVVKPLCLTLDVPYDEDLCDLLFQKLARDVAVTEDQSHSAVSPWSSNIVFLLVLPLWWDLHFKHTPKYYIQGSLISSDNKEHGTESITEESSPNYYSISAMKETIKANASYLERGHRAVYKWLTVLPSSPKACFDAVFFKDSYEYFCTVTNKKLNGVTATEVIGFEARPSDKELTVPSLESILKTFYSVV